MASAATEVFRAVVPDVGLTLKVRSAIDGKQSAYEKRVREDDDAANLLVDYSANVPWTCSFAGDVQLTEIAADEKRRFKPVFFETKYFFRGDFADGARKVRDVQVVHRLASVGESFNFDDGVLVGTLDFINEPGRFKFELKVVFEDGSWRRIAFEFVVVSVKMNIMRDYEAILKTIEEERPRIAQSFLGKSFWGAALGGENKDDDKTWYQILSDVFAYYMRACKRIVNNPHQRFVRRAEYCRADRIRKWTPALVNRFNRLDAAEQTRCLFRTERVEGAIDTPENRFVHYTLKELARRLGRFAAEQERGKFVSKLWVEGVRDMAGEMERLARHPFFAAVGRFEGFRQQSLVMQKRAGYAQIFTVWLKLKRALEPGGNDVDVSYRPISTLYEFWCFLKMREALSEHFGTPKLDEVKTSTEDELLETPELADDSQIDESQLSKLNVVFEKGDVRCVLTYQKTYSVREIDGGAQEAFTSLNPQRPDIVLTLSSREGEFSYLFDAKYRVWFFAGDRDGTTRDAIDAMYRYRDAILYRMQKAGIKREIIGAYVLYPGRPAPHLYEKYEKTIDEEGIGAIPLLPNFDGKLKENLAKIVARHTSAEHLATATSVRGTSVVVGEVPDETTLVNVYWDESVAEAVFAHVCREKICPVEASLVGSDPTPVKKLRIIVGGRVRCVVTAGPTHPGIDPVRPDEMGSDWAVRLKSSGKWYYFFEVSELRAVSDRVDG